MSDQERFSVSWINVAGSALGAVSGAVLLSTLGAAGTVLGAALSSACISVGGAFYAHSMRATKRRLVTSHRTSGVDRGRLEPERPRQAWRQALKELPWRRIALAAAGLFALAMAVILAFELSAGRPVSSFTGGSSDTGTGTSVPGLGDPGPDATTPVEQQLDPSETESPVDPVPSSTSSPSGVPSDVEPGPERTDPAPDEVQPSSPATAPQAPTTQPEPSP